MNIDALELDGVLLVTGKRFEDARGYFEETWSAPRLSAAGFERVFVQDNLSLSRDPGTLRGLHYQRPPVAQGKLVTVLTGAVRDVVVDVREGSPTYLKHLFVELNADRPEHLWVPEGFLHGFVTTERDTRVHYKVTAPYSAEHDGSIAWNDPDIGVDWGVQRPVLSDKDAAAPFLRDVGTLFTSDPS